MSFEEFARAVGQQMKRQNEVMASFREAMRACDPQTLFQVDLEDVPAVERRSIPVTMGVRA